MNEAKILRNGLGTFTSDDPLDLAMMRVLENGGKIPINVGDQARYDDGYYGTSVYLNSDGVIEDTLKLTKSTT